MSRACALSLLAAVLTSGWAALPAVPFADDDQTLLLCHFTRGLDADAAAGDPEAGGSAPLGPGPAGGRAVVLQPGSFLSPDGVRLPTRPPCYRLTGSLDPTRGTIELWFSLAAQHSRDPDATGRYLLDSSGPSGGLSLVVSSGLNGVTLRFGERAGDEPEQTLRADATTAGDGGWRHVALTWDRAQRSLWLDGRRVAGREDAPETVRFGERLTVGGAAGGGGLLGGAITELRLSRGLRYAD